jgi:hypothetical protein
MAAPCPRWATIERLVTVPPADPRASQRNALRRAVLNLVGAVIVFHTVVASIFYLGGIAHGPERIRWFFVIAWSIATAIVVMVMLRNVRRVRFQNRR